MTPRLVCAEVVGSVIAVKGNYCKLELRPSAAVELTKDAHGQIFDGTGRVVSNLATVTAVTDSYVVVRCADGKPTIGCQFEVHESVAWIQQLRAATSRPITVKLFAGRVFEQATLLRVDDTDAKNIRIRIRAKNEDRPFVISMDAVEKITVGKDLVYEHASDEPREKRFSRKQALLAKQHAAYEARLQEWERLLAKTGVRKWELLTIDDHDKAIAEHRDFVASFENDYPNMELYETEHFLICSNIARNHLSPYLRQLDAMHALMMQMYGIPEDVRVWKGKALVVAFVARDQFVDFERKHIKQPPPAGAYGVCHSRSDGLVVVACYRGDNPVEFGQMLVHETSHGFMHRYKTAAVVPSWINEGLADHLGASIVPASQAVPRRQQVALERVAHSRTLGGIVGAGKRNIRADQYGLSSLLVSFLIRNGEERFAKLIDNLKAGLEFRESLIDSYDTTPEQMVQAFGNSIGIANLQP